MVTLERRMHWVSPPRAPGILRLLTALKSGTPCCPVPVCTYARRGGGVAELTPSCRHRPAGRAAVLRVVATKRAYSDCQRTRRVRHRAEENGHVAGRRRLGSWHRLGARGTGRGSCQAGPVHLRACCASHRLSSLIARQRSPTAHQAVLQTASANGSIALARRTCSCPGS